MIFLLTDNVGRFFDCFLSFEFAIDVQSKMVVQADAPLAIRPMLPYLTKSEIHAVMTGGFATIAGSVLAAYIIFGVSFLRPLLFYSRDAAAGLDYDILRDSR